jgi:DNA primase
MKVWQAGFKQVYVKVVSLPKGKQPDKLSNEEITKLKGNPLTKRLAFIPAFIFCDMFFRS